MEEVFAKCHLKKDKSWIDKRAKRAFDMMLAIYGFS
jgi:hypothetical protein